MTMQVASIRVATWWRWLTRPWRSVGLITALIASFAIPAFMAAGADVFQASASDSITRQVLDDDPNGLDVSVRAIGLLAPAGVSELDTAMRNRLEQVGRLTEPDRSLYVPGSDLGLQLPPADEESSAQTIIGTGARFLARDGALEALDVIEGDMSVAGIWISERMAERIELGVGSMVVVNDSDPVPIAGVFANLWEDDNDPYWDDIPPELVPGYSTVLLGPSFELVVVPETVLYGFGVGGIVRWDSVVTDRPDSYDELVTQAVRTRRLERSYTESEEMSAAIAAFSGPGGPVPALITDVADIRRDVDDIIDELEQPIATAAIGGIMLGLIVTAAGAAFAVRKQETEVRLLRSDGDAAWRFAAGALLQYAPPAMVGGVVGVAGAWLLGAYSDESRRAPSDAIDLASVGLTVLIGLLVASVVTGAVASRALDIGRSGMGALRLTWLLPIVGVAGAAWIGVGSASEPGEVDLLVIAFPLVGLIAGVGVVVIAARWAMQRIHRTGGSLPPGLFLAWRRITSADSGATLLSAAMGVALGLIVFSTSLVDSLDSATDAKAIVVVGGETQVQPIGRISGELPDSSTLIHAQRTRLTIGREIVSVLVIDPDDYAEGVSWHPTFGLSAAELVRALDVDVDADVAAVAVSGWGVPRSAGFGTSNVVSYEIVDTYDAVPLASEVYPTLVIRSDQFFAAARRNHDALRPPGVDAEEWAAQFQSPLLRHRQLVVSQLDKDSVLAFLDANEVDARELFTLADQHDLVGNRSARWTFEYLGQLAAIAGLAAVGTLLFYLSEQRQNRRLSMVMTKRMGLRRAAAAGAAVGEVVGLVAIAFIAGTSTALVLATRVFDRFEPNPRLVPDATLEPPWATLGAIGIGAVVVVVFAALVNQWATGRQSYAEVLRDN